MRKSELLKQLHMLAMKRHLAEIVDDRCEAMKALLFERGTHEGLGKQSAKELAPEKTGKSIGAPIVRPPVR